MNGVRVQLDVDQVRKLQQIAMGTLFLDPVMEHVLITLKSHKTVMS
jgi:hypothetical protein